MIDVDQLTRQWVRHLRGARSQRALARRLQYTTNVVYLWESGQRWPTAATFFWLIHRTGGDVRATLRRFFNDGEPPEEPWKPEAVAEIMRKMQGQQTATVLAERTGRSRDAVGRWLRGRSEPRMPDFLRFVDAATTRLLDFIAGFTDPGVLDATADAWNRLEAARRLTRELPWAPAVLLALELEDYHQSPSGQDAEWLARRLGLSPAITAECLQLLSAAGQIRRVGDHWTRVEVQAVDTRVPSRPADLKQWWTGVARDRIPQTDGTASFTICAVSQADYERIQQLQRQLYREVRALIAHSEPSERVVLLVLHTLALDHPDETP